jgi:uncharacterized phage infection (PIP) family protein YhgE
MVNLSKMKKCELIDYCKELKKENEEIKINTMKCCKDLEKEKEEITNKYNEGYDLLCKTKTNMEEMLDKIEELKEGNGILETENIELQEKNEKLLEVKREIDDRNTELTDLFNNISRENQILKRVDKNKAVNKVLEENKHLREFSKNHWEEIDRVRNENEKLKKENQGLQLDIHSPEEKTNREVVKCWILKCLMNEFFIEKNFEVPEKYEDTLSRFLIDLNHL